MGSTQAIVAVLAGGAGSRLGGAKPTVRLGERPLISYPLLAARDAGLEAVVVAKPGTALPDLDARVLREDDPLTHPLAGLLAALESTPGPVVALACDMPFVPAALLAHLAQAPGPLVVRAGGRMQPLLGRYERSAAGRVRTAICRGEATRELAAALEPEVLGGNELEAFGDPARIVFNVNTAEDLERAERMLSGERA